MPVKFDSFFERQNNFLKKIIRASLNKSDLIIAVSPEWGDVFKKISKTKVTVIYNFIDLPEKNNYNKNSTFITTTGQIEIRKGYFDIIKIISSIIIDNHQVKFKFCGNGEVEKIKEEIKTRYFRFCRCFGLVAQF